MSDHIPGSSYDNPIRYRGYRIFLADYAFPGKAYDYVHEDYDGAEDAYDNRCGYAATVQAAKEEIDWKEDDK